MAYNFNIDNSAAPIYQTNLNYCPQGRQGVASIYVNNTTNQSDGDDFLRSIFQEDYHVALQSNLHYNVEHVAPAMWNAAHIADQNVEMASQDNTQYWIEGWNDAARHDAMSHPVPPVQHGVYGLPTVHLSGTQNPEMRRQGYIDNMRRKYNPPMAYASVPDSASLRDDEAAMMPHIEPMHNFEMGQHEQAQQEGLHQSFASSTVAGQPAPQSLTLTGALDTMRMSRILNRSPEMQTPTQIQPQGTPSRLTYPFRAARHHPYQPAANAAVNNMELSQMLNPQPEMQPHPQVQQQGSYRSFPSLGDAQQPAPSKSIIDDTANSMHICRPITSYPEMQPCAQVQHQMPHQHLPPFNYAALNALSNPTANETLITMSIPSMLNPYPSTQTPPQAPLQPQLPPHPHASHSPLHQIPAETALPTSKKRRTADKPTEKQPPPQTLLEARPPTSKRRRTADKTAKRRQPSTEADPSEPPARKPGRPRKVVIQQAFSGWGDNIVGPTPKTEEAETEPNAVTVPAKKGRKKASGFQFVEFGKKQYVEKKRSEAKVVDKQEAKKRREVEEASSSCSSESVRASESAEPAEPAVAPDDEAEHTVGGDATEDIEPADALTQEASDENDIQRNWVWVKAPSSEEVGVNEAGVIGAVGPAWLDTICLLDLSTK